MLRAYLHIHHKVLWEWATEPIENRIEYIKREKPEHERPTRLRLLKEIPLDRIPPELVAAWEKYVAAGKKYDAAAVREQWVAAREKYDAAVEKYAPQMEALHRELCPDCPWDGHTIFPKEGK